MLFTNVTQVYLNTFMYFLNEKTHISLLKLCPVTFKQDKNKCGLSFI